MGSWCSRGSGQLSLSWDCVNIGHDMDERAALSCSFKSEWWARWTSFFNALGGRHLTELAGSVGVKLREWG